MPRKNTPTRIQTKNRNAILDAALDVFSNKGFGGATLDDIAAGAGLSKPNLLYYFETKETIYLALLEGQLDTWLDPLRALDPDGEPLDQLLDYARRKLELSRDHPRESRLFAHEIIQGAPRIAHILSGDLKALVDAKTAVIDGWITQGRIAPVPPMHLIFSIWALTQHYADFDAQIRAVSDAADPLDEAQVFVDTLYRRLLTP
ncbi:MAG: TetR family transcriptional regulator C-terminal domain-containing protein [Pseudomonadota bacterium]